MGLPPRDGTAPPIQALLHLQHAVHLSPPARAHRRLTPARPDEPIHQPHDKLFKSAFADAGNAAAFLHWQLPPALGAAICWDRLKLQPGNFVDSHYRNSESDLLFSAPLAGSADCLIYLLFEHQRAEEPRMALRLLRYMVRIWEEFTRAQPLAPLPVILPVVLAQNAEAWNISPRFTSLLDVPAALTGELSGFVPDFTFRLIQLANLDFEAIRGTPAGILTLRVMKAERLARLLDDSVWDERLFLQVPRETLEMLIRYILDADVDKQAFDRRLDHLTHPQIRSTAMTLAQQLRQEGRQEGHQEAIIDNLCLRLGEVPQGLAETVRGIFDDESLRRLQRASLEANSMEEFAASL